MQAAYGETLKVVGSSGSLGAWDAAAAPEMRWADGHIWALDLDLPEMQALSTKLCTCTATACHGRAARTGKQALSLV